MLKQILYYSHYYRRQIRSAVLSVGITMILSLTVIGALALLYRLILAGAIAPALIITIIALGAMVYMAFFVLNRR